jgi:hypothetical protein
MLHLQWQCSTRHKAGAGGCKQDRLKQTPTETTKPMELGWDSFSLLA